MDFTVVAGNEELFFTGESRYVLEDNGVLTVYSEDGSRVRFSPAGWTAIKDEPPQPFAFSV